MSVQGVERFLSPLIDRSRIKAFIACACVILVDQVTKIAARKDLMKGIPREVFGDFVRFTLRFNEGAAFSLGWGGPLILIFLTALACVLLIRYMMKAEAYRCVLWLGVILGGALGNLIDRVLMGSVTDFIDVGTAVWRWPTFNVADIAICIGGIAVFLVYRKTRRLEVSSEETE